MPDSADEPLSPIERWDDLVERTFEYVQRALIGLVGLVLVGLSIMALWDTVRVVRDQLEANQLTAAITAGVDTVFLTIILLELLHTVLSRAPLARQASDFIIIGITSAIRHGLGPVATSAGGGSATSARETVINLGINSMSVLILVAALWLVRQQSVAGVREGEAL